MSISEDNLKKQIWDSAKDLNTSLDTSEYKHIVLGLIFLRYVSNKFEERYHELVKEGAGFEEDKDEYTAENVFFVPPEARWSEIIKNAHTEKNGIVIDNAMKSIENENTSLKGILPKTFSKPELNKIKLGELIDLFTNIGFEDYKSKTDVLANIYEYCLNMFAKEERKNASNSYTPNCITKLLVSILKPLNGRIYDPCCGSAGMLVQSKKFIESKNDDVNKVSFYGQEINSTAWKLAKINLAIRGIEANLGEYNSDSFLNDLHSSIKFDYIFANPIFNDNSWYDETLKEDSRWNGYCIPPEGNANFAWILHMISHLSSRGKIGLVLANGSLSTTKDEEKRIREKIIENDLLECIISLPDKLFNNSISVCLWFLNNNKSQKGKTLFIDARDMGELLSKSLRILTDDDVGTLTNTFDKFQEGYLEDEIGFCKVADFNEIENQDFIIVPGRYVGFKPETDDGIPFEVKMEKLKEELYVLFEESHDLENKIKKSLEEIGF